MSADNAPSEAKPELKGTKPAEQIAGNDGASPAKGAVADGSEKAPIEVAGKSGKDEKPAPEEGAEGGAIEGTKKGKAEKGKRKREREREKEAEKEKEKDEEKVLEERSLTVNLRHAYLTHGRKAAPKAVRLVKEKARKVFKTEDVKLDGSINEALWSRGKTKTERKIAIKVQKLEGGEVRVLAAEG